MGDFTLSLVDKVTGPVSDITGSLDKLMGSMGGAEGGMGGLGGAMEALADPASIAVAAVAAIGAAVGAAVIAGASLALEMSELREKTVATFSALAGGKEAGEATLAMLDNLRAATGMTRAELTPLASKLMGMGIQGKALQDQLTALATVKAIGSDGGTEAYTNVLKKLSAGAKLSSKDLTNLSKTGVNVNDMAKTLGVSVKQLEMGLKNGSISSKAFGDALQKAVTAKGADALAAQANSLTNQWALFKENLGQLFEGVDAGPFLAELKSLLGIFSQSTASGKAMKSAITGFFNGLFAIAAKVLPYIKMFLLQLVIGALKLYISLKPAIAHFKALFASASGGDTLGKVIKWIADNIMHAIGAVAMFVVGVMYAWEFSLKAFAAIGGAIQSVGAWIVDLGKSILGVFSGALELGTNFVNGLIQGIKDGVGRAVQAAKDLAGSVVDGAKSMLGIHSPSKVMAQLGGHTATGFAQGIAAANDNVSSAANGMAAAAMSPSIPAPSGAPIQGGGGGSVTINAEINITAPNGVTGAQELTETAVTLLFERAALAQGLGSAA